MGYFSNGGRGRNEIWHKGSLGDKDDARTSNPRMAHKKRATPHSTMNNNRNIIGCCNNTHQGAPRTGKRTIRTRILLHMQHQPVLALRTSVTAVTLLVLLGVSGTVVELKPDYFNVQSQV